MKTIAEGAYVVALGAANAVLLDAGPELVLVDAGFPGKASVLFDGIRQLGRTPRDLRHLIAGDVGMNILGLGDPVGFEEGPRSQRNVATLRFDAAVFGHGQPIRFCASERLRRKWASLDTDAPERAGLLTPSPTYGPP